MKLNKVYIFFSVVFLLLVWGGTLNAEETKAENAEKAKPVWGFIVNTPSIFSQIDSYQGGIGLKSKGFNDMKVFGQDVGMDLRILVGLGLTDGFNILNLKGGVAVEFHLYRTSRVTPYFGLLADLGYNKIRTELDDGSWTQLDTVPLSAGGMAGIEFFLLEFLSVFVEYNFALTLEYSNLTGSDIVETDPVINYSLGTGLGNYGMIGIVIYFKPVVTIKK